MSDVNANLLRGTLDLLILRSLADEPRHGYGVLEWMEGTLGETVLVEEGTLYPALHRLEERGLLQAEWGVSENNRRAKFYRITSRGRERLDREGATWRAYAEAVRSALETA